MKPAQQSLFPALPARQTALRPRVPRPVRLPRFEPLWLAVHLPALALETLTRGQEIASPCAVIDAAHVARIHAVNARAEAAGVLPGMTLAAAWSRFPALDVYERDAEREQRTLRRLAAWAGRFTPTVCIEEQALLLEVRGSLSLFQGAAALRGAVQAGIHRLGFDARIALAPTPRAASWLANAGRDVHVDRIEALPGVLGELPLSMTGFDAELLDKFHGIGARRLRDLMRLPRDGFARRYGFKVLRELDQALGRAPDVRRPLPPPKTFFSRIDLLYEISDTDRLRQPMQQLLRELDDYLRATQQGVSRLHWRFLHRDGSHTEMLSGFAQATRDAARIRDLVEQKLETLALPAPALEVHLQARDPVPLAGRDRTLFVEQRVEDDDWLQLVERLRARLGAEAVTGIDAHADHRPERAWKFTTPGFAQARTVTGHRPHWLLAKPQPLKTRGLEMLQGPERIETGWWDGGDVKRDYHVARDAQGRRLWVFRDVNTGRWWLHGIFG